jgi:uncharacterized protein (UPF0276 family)
MPTTPNPLKARPPEAPYLGVGIGLRPVHFPEILERGPRGELGVDWLEILSENYMIDGGRPLRILDEVKAFSPLVMHGVSMSIGSVDPLDTDYLDDLAKLADRVAPRWISDHLCWTGVDAHNLHDLMPLPYTDEAVAHVANRVRRVQDRLGRRIALENVSSYVAYTEDSMSEAEFLGAIAEAADCGILLDVNNIYVSAHNHGTDAEAYVDTIAPERVFQIHLAGHSEAGDLLIDTHDHPVRAEVWALYERAIERMGPVSTLIEWDDEIPPYETLLEEADRARAILERLTPPQTKIGSPHVPD